MAAPTDEARYTAQLRGLRATADLALALPLLHERREALLRQAIMDFRAKKLDGIGALLAIAALSENLQLRDDLEHVERQGQRASAQLAGVAIAPTQQTR